MAKYVLDTSVIIEKIASDLIKKKELKGTIIIPHFVIAELENQANRGLEIGFIGLEEIQEIRKIGKKNKVELEFYGQRPTEHQIKFAKSGEIDAAIRAIAVEQKATLITADKVQAESGKAFGIKVKHYELRKYKDKLSFEKYFDEHTMSLHLKEGTYAKAKRGIPGEWGLVKVSKEKYSSEEMEALAKEIVEKSRVEPDAFVEISRRGSTIIQYKDYRVVIVKPPVSDGWEITVVKPVKKLNLDYYKFNEKVMKKLEEKNVGILIVGETGSGKSTFAQSLAEFYVNLGRVTKTIESPRDLQVIEEVTQYNKNYASSEELHDILFLSRPDNIIFDEIRDTPDFNLYIDLNLAGSVIGVIHSLSPIDAVQRFIGRIEIGLIPSVLNLILFVDKGQVARVLDLKMIVKVPSGMTEADLARPVVEVRDFETSKLEYEIYSYGEQTVIIPVTEVQKRGIEKLAEEQIERELQKYSAYVKADIINPNRAIIYVEAKEIPKIIGAGGKNIEKIEQKLGIGLEVREFEGNVEKKIEGENIGFNFQEKNKFIVFYPDKSGNVDFYLDGEFLFSAIVGKKGIKLHKKSKLGRVLLRAIDEGRNIEVRKG